MYSGSKNISSNEKFKTMLRLVSVLICMMWINLLQSPSFAIMYLSIRHATFHMHNNLGLRTIKFVIKFTILHEQNYKIYFYN